MIIGYDGKRAVGNLTGLGNYSRLVIESMAEEYPSDHVFVYIPVLKENWRLLEIAHLHNAEFRLPAAMGFSGSLWRTFGITNNLVADGVDIYHGLSNELPLNIKSAGIPTVLTMHDVIYRRLPEDYKTIDRKIYNYKYGRSCRNATRIIAVSERTKKDVVEYYDIDPDRIDVIYQGCDPEFRHRPSDFRLAATRLRLGLPPRYILQVGSIEPRKNLLATVKALQQLPEDVMLVAVGHGRRDYEHKVMEEARSLGVAHRVMMRHDIDFTDLPSVNRLACAAAYPSHYEGFGLQVLEALESEVPVVAATGSCLEETGGDAAIFVDPEDAYGLGNALRAIIDGSVSREAMVAKGKAHAQKFKSEEMASKTMEVYHQAIEDFKRSK